MGKIHADVSINGIVQGVGFRPFIHKRVSEFCLSGRIRNTSFGVELSLEGERERIEEFLETLALSAPPLAKIYELRTVFSETLSVYVGFEISESEAGERKTFISPDTAVCEDCRSELFDSSDRRFRYPFINCTNCGPRFTITRDVPYDRKNTTMSAFPMCAPCAEEYADIESRRYHAQPDCCEDCGPHLFFLDDMGVEVGGDAIENAKALLSSGGICAIKGLGGYHLACRADKAETVLRLRERKRRDEKPFAVMCRDVETAKELAFISAEEERILTSRARPIVLLRKRDKTALSHISENGYIGIMLPYTPVHHLLMEGSLSFLVMTSANISELPIIYKDEEAKAVLSSVADGFLANDREIFVRCDDSLVWEFRGKEYFARRSRGYAPLPVSVADSKRRILAVGAEQKASFSLSRDGMVFPSAHIGDMKNLETLSCFEEQVEHFEKIFDVKPELIVCDMHPDYLSGEYARRRAKREGIPLRGVYHHHAHMASCMADNGLDGDVLGIIWDGTGAGKDGKAWGAELLCGGYASFSRLATMRGITLPGGDIATKEITRIGASLLVSAGLDPTSFFGARGTLATKILESGINCPTVSSMGRMFDGVAAILGIREVASFEGQAATLLEAAAEDTEKVYAYSLCREDGLCVLDWREMILEIAKDKQAGVPISEIAAAFMNTMVASFASVAKREAEERSLHRVVLSGGSFQNMYMLKRLCKKLSAEGLSVYTHSRVSANDEGLSLGQLMIAERGGGENVPCSTT